MPLDNGETVCFTVSLGIAAYEPGGPIQAEDELLREADKAMYKAKANGRNQVVVA